jgi:hypothetical protein
MAHGTVATKVHGHSHRLSAGITQASQSSASWMPGGKASTLPSYLPLFPIYFGFSLSLRLLYQSPSLSLLYFFLTCQRVLGLSHLSLFQRGVEITSPV